MSALSRLGSRLFGAVRRSRRRHGRGLFSGGGGQPDLHVRYRIKGVGAVERAFDDLADDITDALPGILAEAGELVRQDASDLFSSISPDSAAGFRVRVRKRGAVVAQSKRKKTGQRGDYGRLQMERALIPALRNHERDAVRRVEKMVDEACRSFNRRGSLFGGF